MSQELETTLCAVRKSYRLLYDYHRRVQSTIDQITSNLGLNFYRWESAVSKPKSGSDPHKRWTWDAFPQLEYSSLFARNLDLISAPGDGDFLFEIRVQSDNSIFEQGYKTEPAPHQTAADKAETQLVICIWVCNEMPKEDSVSFDTIWNYSDYPTTENAFFPLKTDYGNFSVMKVTKRLSALSSDEEVVEFSNQIGAILDK
ncbi:MAG: hypothetical protein ABJG15_08150 [Hyphomonadaceae bacterium]